MNEELPELPDAIAIRTRLVPDGPEIIVARGFSDEMMRSYALSAVLKERAENAAICEAALKDYSSPNEEDFTSEIPWEAEAIGGISMAKRLAAAIREKAPLKEGE